MSCWSLESNWQKCNTLHHDSWLGKIHGTWLDSASVYVFLCAAIISMPNSVCSVFVSLTGLDLSLLVGTHPNPVTKHYPFICKHHFSIITLSLSDDLFQAAMQYSSVTIHMKIAVHPAERIEQLNNPKNGSALNWCLGILTEFGNTSPLSTIKHSLYMKI